MSLAFSLPGNWISVNVLESKLYSQKILFDKELKYIEHPVKTGIGVEVGVLVGVFVVVTVGVFVCVGVCVGVLVGHG